MSSLFSLLLPQWIRDLSTRFLLFCFIHSTGPCSSISLCSSPAYCSSFFYLQGGRQVTAVGGRRACHVRLCLGLHQNMPSHVALATAFPLIHPTVFGWKWQHSVSFQKVTTTFNSPPPTHVLLSYTVHASLFVDFWGC